MHLKKITRFDQRKATFDMNEQRELQLDKEKIILTIAHEIRSPLAAIKLANQLLQQAHERNEIDKVLVESFIKVIDHNVTIIDDYIKRLLASKMQQLTSFKPVNISQCLDNA